MALTLSTLPPLYPAYTQNLIFTAKESTAINNYYYKIDVYMNGSIQDSFKYFASPLEYDATINLSTILQLYFTSNVYIPTGNTICEIVPNSIIPYYVNVTCYNVTGGTVSSGHTATLYTFNGCENPEEVFNMQSFIMQSGSTGNWFTNNSANRSITLNDYCYLSAVAGHYGSGYYANQYNSVFSGVSITAHYVNGSTTTITETFSDTGKNIINIDLSPAKLNSLHTNFITANTLYYDVKEINSRSTYAMRVEINNETKLRKFYNFIYLNRLGGQDCFSFTKVSQNDYKIAKSLLDQFLVQKVYYTKVDKTTTIQSQQISYLQMQGLNELFSSLAVKLWFNNYLADIRLINTGITVNDRYPKNVLLQFTAQIQYNNKYYIQLY